MPKQRNGTWEHGWMVLYNEGRMRSFECEDTAWDFYKRARQIDAQARFIETYTFIPR